MNIKPFKGVFPKVDLITSPGSFFSNIKYQYLEYRNSGFYNQSKKDGYFIYKIKNEYGTHTGLLCTTSVSDLRKGAILKHEKTLAAKEQQMMHLLLQRKALVKPVLLGYNPIDKITDYLKYLAKTNKPDIRVVFKSSNEEHLIWKVYDKDDVSKISKSFSKLKKAYIGDGHHRTTTIALLNSSEDLGAEAEKYSELLTGYFPFSELKIFDFNRVVDITDIMPSSQFMAELAKYFNIKMLSSAKKPTQKHVVTCYIDNNWYELNWKKKYLKTTEDFVLDTALINKFIFGKILNITDVRVDMRIKYYGGTEPLSKVVKQSNKYHVGVGICIYPVSSEELTSIADKNETLPPKSTWFMPRLKSGIIAKDL